MSADYSNNNKRIARNTFLLYLRMLFLLILSLYTSRVLLDALGVEDFGLYNVVGGIVAIFTFICTAMSNSTLRFITFELGKDDSQALREVVTVSRLIHLVLGILIVILAETIGLWYFNHFLVVQESRFDAAFWVFQISIIACFVTITIVPYNAMVIAHEKMSAYAVISCIDGVLKLLIALLIRWSSFDHLVFYSVLLLFVQVFDLIFYHIYCTRHFSESKFSFHISIRKLKEMSEFAGWSMIGNLAWIGYTQGLNLLLNAFFGTAVNAARGVAVQVQNAVTNFVKSFQSAINPQITKAYAQGDTSRFHDLICTSSKFAYYLVLLFVLPIILEADYILGLWLIEVPDHTVNFVRLIMLIMLIGPFENPIANGIQATGNIRTYQILEGGLLLLIVPLSYVALSYGSCPAESVFVIQFIIYIVVQIVRVYLSHKNLRLSYSYYFRKIIYKITVVTILALPIPVFLRIIMDQTVVNFLIVTISSLTSVIFCAYFFGLENNEKTFVRTKINSVIHKL